MTEKEDISMGKKDYAEEFQQKKKMNVLDDYLRAIYKIVMIGVAFAALAGGILFGFEKLLGCLKDMNTGFLLFYIGTCVFWLVFNLYRVRQMNRKGDVDAGMLRNAKIHMFVLIAMQWNIILYLIPNTTVFWTFYLFFIMWIGLFLDLKLLVSMEVTVVLSLVVHTVIRGACTLPVKDADYIPQLVLGIIIMIFSCILFTGMVWLITHFLANAREEQIAQNDSKVEHVMQEIRGLSGKLADASSHLMDASEKESESMTELSSINQELLASSDHMVEKSESNGETLGKLEEASRGMASEMKNVDSISKDIVSISKTSDESLGHLVEINEEVERATKNSMEVTDRLLDETGEIGTTLGVISEIADSINLLSLNASIEAARAGEAGKGFAVVAGEIGRLADSTKQSLDNIAGTIERIEGRSKEVRQFMDVNAEQLVAQKGVLEETVSNIKRMIEYLASLDNAIGHADRLSSRQVQFINESVNSNGELMDSIKQECVGFRNISDKVQENMEEIEAFVEEIEALNRMVESLEALMASNEA